MQVELDKLLKVYQDKGFDLVQTTGVINSDKEYNTKNPVVYENTLTKVSGFGYFFLDIRSNNKKQRDDYTREGQGNHHVRGRQVRYYGQNRRYGIE